jgi:hypothetical protein
MAVKRCARSWDGHQFRGGAVGAPVGFGEVAEINARGIPVRVGELEFVLHGGQAKARKLAQASARTAARRGT